MLIPTKRSTVPRRRRARLMVSELRETSESSFAIRHPAHRHCRRRMVVSDFGFSDKEARGLTERIIRMVKLGWQTWTGCVGPLPTVSTGMVASCYMAVSPTSHGDRQPTMPQTPTVYPGRCLASPSIRFSFYVWVFVGTSCSMFRCVESDVGRQGMSP